MAKSVFDGYGAITENCNSPVGIDGHAPVVWSSEDGYETRYVDHCPDAVVGDI